MAGMTAHARELAALGITGNGAWVSIHSADPGESGSSEAYGAGYAREATTWDETGGTSDGVVAGSPVLVSVPAGTYTHAGLWTSETDGAFLGSAVISTANVGTEGGAILVNPSVTAV